jgi:uncharacterized protein YndB with AHSA1/START domain
VPSEAPDAIRWPAEFEPSRAPVHVKNELEMPAAPEAVWACLARAAAWPDWYPNSARVRMLNGGGPDLVLGTRFRWITFGMPILSEVKECAAPERLAWDARGPGVHAYHAWLVTRTRGGCRVLTEETQHGVAARLQGILLPRRMWRGHQIWLERLRDLAAQAPFPPA